MQAALTLSTNATIGTPLMLEFSKTEMLQNFLSSTLICVICFLAILTSQLLYSLTLGDVETKTYEYGMLRALGFKSTHLMSMITLQSFFFSFPGVVAGIAVALTFNVLIRFMIYALTGNAAGFGLSTMSLVIGISFGIIMPLISILLPIQAALGKNLRSSLDLNHRSNNEKSASVQRLEDMGLSPTQTIIGLMLVGYGFVTYYLVPLTFFNEQMKWYLLIFDALLIMIILGLTFLSLLLFEHLEKGLLTILMWTCARPDRKLKGVIERNLDGHRNRNSKTSIMFTLAMGYLIYAASSFELLSGMIRGTVITQFGSDLYIKSSPSLSLTGYGTFLDEQAITDFVDLQTDGAIDQWGFVSISLYQYQYLVHNSKNNT